MVDSLNLQHKVGHVFEMGFTTCLILRIDDDGTCTIANAGHFAPYLAGRELAVDHGLPLGLTESVAYI